MNSAPRHTRVRERNQAYANRILVAVAITTALAILTVHLPFGAAPQRVGWRVVSPEEIIALEDIRIEDGISQIRGSNYREATPVIAVALPADQTQEDIQSDSTEATLAEVRDEPGRRMNSLAPLILAAAETMPEIRGGMGAYYINIIYPKVAIDAGIEGRLVLDFVVNADGRPSQIEVYSPLHPLCDSSAVRALRKTLFMPGRNNGKAVAVRMRLPVVFRIQRSDPDP